MTESKELETPAPPSKAIETGEIDRFPQMVFRAGHQVRVWGQYDVDTLVVNSQTALEDALRNGWHVDPANIAGPEDTIPGEGAPKRRRGRPPKGTNMGKEGKDAGELPPEQDPANIAYDPFKDPGNPRPNEPDNAPLRNTPYDDPQTGDLADPPTSPAEPPVQTPIPPTDVKPDDGDGLDKPPPGTDPPLGGEGTLARGRPENDLPDSDKGLPGKPGAILGGAGPLDAGKGAKGGAGKDEDALRSKGAPPGSHKAK